MADYFANFSFIAPLTDVAQKQYALQIFDEANTHRNEDEPLPTNFDEGDGDFTGGQRAAEVEGRGVFDVLRPLLIAEGEQHFQNVPEPMAAGMGRIEKTGAVAVAGGRKFGHGWPGWGGDPVFVRMVLMFAMRPCMRSL